MASLTYQNESGGTEQHKVAIPWTLEFHASSGTFVYLSAQKQGRFGPIEAAIYVDGEVLQKAQSTEEYGIASVSGAVR